MYILDTNETQIHINGQLLPVKVRYEIEYDDYPIEDSFDFGDEKENEAYIERFRTGELESLIITVTAFAVGETGSDSLGGVHVVAGKSADIYQTIENHDMVGNALTALKERIVTHARELQPYLPSNEVAK